jgi:tetratricopeptide (TPR) repeat protein
MLLPGTLLAAAFLLLSMLSGFPAENPEPYSHERRSIEKPVENAPLERIFSKNEILYCTGESEAALACNRAAGQLSEGKFQEAAFLLEKALRHAPLFLPFRYNLGMCYIFLNRLDLALLHFEKAAQLLPEYPPTYIQMGYIYGRWGKEDAALDHYRTALRNNPREMLALTLMGDLYFRRNQVEMASQYYGRALSIEPRYPNALLGKAKIHFSRGEYFKTMIQIKSIDLSGEYDKALHYYYAEAAFKLKDYQTAYDQYTILLRYRADKFFLTNSVFLIQHKVDLSRRFIER